MEDSGPGPRTLDEIWQDFQARRLAFIKALTTDAEEFYNKCDPERENLCLYGLPNGQWELSLPDEELPPRLPEPTLGINFARDGMHKEDWLSLVAEFSDIWLLAHSFFIGARYGFHKSDRQRLFNMINRLPTVCEVVTRTSNWNSELRKYPKVETKDEDEGLDEEDDEEHGDTLCSACGDNYGNDDELWMGCDTCERWFHAKCVKNTPARGKHSKQYKCRACRR